MLNKKQYCKNQKIIRYEHNRLCDECNLKQQTKVNLLADFVPIDENNFDREVYLFKRDLENLYQLCDDCELLIKKLIDESSKSKSARLHSPLKTSTSLKMDLNKNYWLFSNEKTIIYYLLNFITILILVNQLLLKYHNDQSYNFASENIFPIDTMDERYILSALFITFFMQLQLEKLHFIILDLFQIMFWLILITNNLNYHLLSLSNDQLLLLHKVMFIFLILIYLFKIFLHIFIDNKNNDSNLKVKRNSETGGKIFNHLNDNKNETDYIRQHIADLSLSEYYNSHNDDNNNSNNNNYNNENFNVFSKNFLSSHPMDNKITMNNFAHQLGNNNYRMKNFSYYYTLSNTSHHPLNHSNNSKIDNYRILNYCVAYENDHSSAKNNSLTSNILNIFTAILLCMILTMMIIILSMPVYLDYKINSSSLYFNVTYKHDHI